MKYVFTAFIAIGASIFLAAPAVGDWDVRDGHKMHWPQMPDLTETGLDVLASWFPDAVGTAGYGKTLADDWRCTGEGPVTDIHIWGSWLNDDVPWDDSLPNNQHNVVFKLSIHDDLTGADPSRPGVLRRQYFFQPGDPRWTARLYKEGVQENFYDPNQQIYIGTDTQVWQYNFYIDQDDAFFQEEGKIYWLDVQAMPLMAETTFGWKTSLDNWRDDAVYGDNTVFDEPPQDWMKLVYPDGHRYEGETIDMAFVITPEPGTIVMLIGAGLIGLVGYARRRRKS